MRLCSKFRYGWNVQESFMLAFDSSTVGTSYETLVCHSEGGFNPDQSDFHHSKHVVDSS